MGQNIGKVGLSPQGKYESGRTYVRLMTVSHNGNYWVAVKDVPANAAPYDGSAYWHIMAEKGIQGPQGQSYVDREMVPIVDNLTQGGSANVLSAEQGKILKQELTELESKAAYESRGIAERVMNLVAGVEHSSNEDKILFNIKKGEAFFLELMGLSYTGTLEGYAYAFYADDTKASLGNMSLGANKQFTASNDIVAIGFYVVPSSSGLVHLRVAYAKDSPIVTAYSRGTLIYDNDKQVLSINQTVNVHRNGLIDRIQPFTISAPLSVANSTLYKVCYNVETLEVSVKVWSVILSSSERVLAKMEISAANKVVSMQSWLDTEIQGSRGSLLGNFFLTHKGYYQASSSWRLWAFPIKGGCQYKIRTHMNAVGEPNTSKKSWVVLSQDIVDGSLYDEASVIDSSRIYGGAVIGKHSDDMYVNHVITTPQNARTIVICVGDGDLSYYGVEEVASQSISVNDIFPKGQVSTIIDLYREWQDITPIIFNSAALYEGSVPAISFEVGGIYHSVAYTFGGDNGISQQQWRIPYKKGDSIVARITIPADTTFRVDNMNAYSCQERPTYHGGVRLDAHLGFQQYAPENTLAAFEWANKVGYPACIVNPIVSKDGTFFCYHQGNKSLTLDGVNAVSLTIDEFANLTDAEVAQYKVLGLGNVVGHYSEPIPTLASFFQLCAKTGMRPMFSTHPLLTSEQWNEIRASLIKYRLLDKLTIKSFSLENLVNAFSIMGNDIERYILDVATIDADSYISQIQNSALASAKNVGIEYPALLITEDCAETTIASGYICSAWEVYRISGERYNQLIRYGVTEFTDDNNCCAGLNW